MLQEIHHHGQCRPLLQIGSGERFFFGHHPFEAGTKTAVLGFELCLGFLEIQEWPVFAQARRGGSEELAIFVHMQLWLQVGQLEFHFPVPDRLALIQWHALVVEPGFHGPFKPARIGKTSRLGQVGNASR